MVKRIVETSFWTDMQVIDQYSVEDKFFYLYLLTNDKSTQIGIYPLPKKVMSFETGFTTDVIQVLIERFSKQYKKILYSEETQEITLLESLKFSILSGGKPVLDLLEREISKVKDDYLILATYEEMREYWLHSKRKIDQEIMELFENEMTSRNLIHNQNQNHNQSHNHIYIHSQSQNHNHNHNQESSITSRPTNRDSNREMNDEIENIDKDEEKRLERYAQFIKQSSIQTNIEITPDNILEIFYEEQCDRLSPEVHVRFAEWSKIYPKSLILEALHRSRNAKKPISYANTIIENWKKQGVRTCKDVIRLDNEFNHWGN